MSKLVSLLSILYLSFKSINKALSKLVFNYTLSGLVSTLETLSRATPAYSTNHLFRVRVY